MNWSSWTIPSINAYDTADVSIESFATNLFNTWSIGDQPVNRGVLLLVAAHDRKVRIALGAGYDASYDSRAEQVITTVILPDFRESAYSAGIVAGVHGIAQMVAAPEATTNTPGGAGTIESQSPRIRDNSAGTSSGVPTGFLIGGGVAAVGAAFLGVQGYQRYQRFRPRPCPHCGVSMTRLDEIGDDVYLDSGQKLEEVLGSIDYDIWKCPSCNQHDLLRYPAMFSSLRACFKCGYRTMRVTTSVLEDATYDSSGRKELNYDCDHCQAHSSDIVTIPRRSRPSNSSSSSGSSSSSSSSGGGYSSGGGASGSW